MSPRKKDPNRREHIVILLDDDIRIEGDLLTAELRQLHEVAFAIAADNGMEFDAFGRPRPSARPNAAFGRPKRKSVTLTLKLTLDPDNAVVWNTRRQRSAPVRPVAAVPLTPMERALRGDFLLALMNAVPMPETADAYRRMTGRAPPQRRLTAGSAP